MRTVKAYFIIGEAMQECDLGHKHPITVYGEKKLVDTGETATRDWWGYGRATTSTETVWMDNDENLYYEVPAMDYHAGTIFRCFVGKAPSLMARKPNGVRFDQLGERND